MNDAFNALKIDVHALDEETVLNHNISDDHNIDRVLVILKDSTLGGLSPHITRLSTRNWKFQTLGKSSVGGDEYGPESFIYKPSVERLFEDRPHFDNNTFIGLRANQMRDADNWSTANGILDPVNKVEDENDNGAIDSREDALENSRLDGDYPVAVNALSQQMDPAYYDKEFLPPTDDADPLRPGLDVDGDGTDETYDYRFDLSPFDVDSDTEVEVNLPVVSTSAEIDPLYENSSAQVLMMVISHEAGHAVAIGPHTSVSTCNMYYETNNFVRKQFSHEAADLIRIHNN